jgi:hypothetical protein
MEVLGMGTDKPLAAIMDAVPGTCDSNARARPTRSAHAGRLTSNEPRGEAEDSSLVEAVVLQLNTPCKNATFDFAMAVGKLIVDTIYSGDLDSWRDRGHKCASFRKLARHPDLPMSPSALYRSVAIYELTRRLGAAPWKNISTSHLRLVLPLPRDRQLELIQHAEANRWSVQRLREEIFTHALHSTNAKARGGRKAQSPLRRTILTLQKYVDSSNCLIGAEHDVELSPESACRVTELAARLQESCALLRKNLASRYAECAHTDPAAPVAVASFNRASHVR